MKITIFTLANMRPDFIEPQYASIKKFVKDADVEYLVFNNAYSHKGRSDDIEKICKKLGVRSIKIPRGKGKDPSTIVGESLNYAWQNHLVNLKDIVCSVDSDMFFIKETFMEKMMSGFDFAFVPYYRGNNFEIFCPLSGLLIFNMNTLPNTRELLWDPGIVLGHGTDVGARNHFYLQKYEGKIRHLYLEFLNLRDIESEGGVNTLTCSVNGNFSFAMKYEGDKVLEVTSDEPHISDKRSFPYQEDREDYYPSILRDFMKMKRYLGDKGVHLPKPMFVDFFKVYKQDIASSFIFHYTRGSNYSPLSTRDYNTLKTRELYRLLHALGVIHNDFEKISDKDLVPRYLDVSPRNVFLQTKKLVKKIIS